MLLKIVSTAKEVEKTLLDFENVGRVCLDCKSKLHLNNKQRTVKMGFPDWWGKTKKEKKNKNQKTNIWVKKELFTLCSKTHWQTRWKWDSNLDLGVKGRRRQKLDLRLDLGMLTVEMRSDEREAQPWMFWGVDGDEECRGLVLCWGNRRDIGSDEERWATKGYTGSSLSGFKNCYSYMCLAFLTKINTLTKHIFYVFWTLKHVI